jgi:hypothetical protein
MLLTKPPALDFAIRSDVKTVWAWRYCILQIVFALCVAAAFWATPAHAGSCSSASGSVTDSIGTTWNTLWYCGNRQGAQLYRDASYATPVNYMNTTWSWFVCYRRGAQHSGGNDVWYYSLGDKAGGAWGYMPAVDVWTDQDPWPGMPACPGATSGGSSMPPAIASNADGRLELFVRGSDGALWHKWQTAPGGSWSNWASLGGQISDFVVGQNLDGRLEVFAIGAGNQPYHIWQTSSGWSGWAGMGGCVKKLAVARNRDGRLELFGIGSDNQLYGNWQTSAGGGWSGWAGRGGWISDLSVAQNKDGRLEVFAIGQGNVPYHMWQNCAGCGWSGWAGLGGYVIQLAATRNADGRLELFGIGGDNKLYHMWQSCPGCAFGGWASLDGWVDQLAVTLAPSGALAVFARGSDRAMWHKWQTSGGWSGWVSLGGTLDQIAVGANRDGRLEAFTTGTDGALWHTWQTCAGCGWSGWASLGAPNTLSTVGGPISRSEMISRAKYWVDYRPTIQYSQSASAPDPQGRLYRSDCSGYVSMAWHLASSPNTEGLINYVAAISKEDLRQGDAMGSLGAGTGGDAGHVRIFDKWDDAGHSHYSAWDFGETPPQYKTNIAYPGVSLGGFVLKPYRYTKVSD